MKLLLYCTKGKPDIMTVKYVAGPDNYCKLKETHFNGKIVAECDFEVEKIKNELTQNDSHLKLYTDTLTEKELFEKSCLNRYEMFNYLQNNFTKKSEPNGYTIHIKNLNKFDEPKELSDYRCKKSLEKIKMAPQNMMYVHSLVSVDDPIENNIETDVLISIRPEWLCKILNGEKTIEVRKKVLKEML